MMATPSKNTGDGSEFSLASSPPGGQKQPDVSPAASVVSDSQVDEYVDNGVDVVGARDASGVAVGGWNGRRTQFTLAHPVVKDHVGLGAGATVIYDAAYQDGRWQGPEASTVVLQFQNGFFAGTEAARERARRAAAVEYERGVGRDPQGPDGPGPEGLEALTSEQQLALLDDMLRGGVGEAKRKEAQEARETTEAIRADRKELVNDLVQAFRGAKSD